MNVCPQKCIAMKADPRGFYYPLVDEQKCVQCKACVKACPVNKEVLPVGIERVWVCKSRDEKVRAASSSGGVFTAIAEYVIDNGGVVFGACFDSEWNVVHDYVESNDELYKFRGSKYVQSRAELVFPLVKKFLNDGRWVLFSGTPCQIAGMRGYLHKDYERLILLDFICHGVPSGKVWQRFLVDEVALLCDKNSVLHRPICMSSSGGLEEKKQLIKTINFRDKATGWQKYSFALALSEASAEGKKNTVLHSAIAWEHPFMKGFLGNLFLRPSCYACPMKGFRSHSDITMADAWGIANYLSEWDDDKGASLCVPHTEKGKNVLEGIRKVDVREINKDIIEKHNDAAYYSPRHNKHSKRFYRLMDKGVPFREIIDACFPATSWWDRIMWSINKRLDLYVRREK